MYIEHVGDMKFTRILEKPDDGFVRRCPEEITVTMKRASWGGANKYAIEANFKVDGDKYKIHGTWNKAIYLENLTKNDK